CPSTSLAVGTHMTCTATHTVTQADLDACSVTNKVTVSSDQGAGGTDSLTIKGTCTPLLSITKKDDLNPQTYNAVGQVVTYTIVATNAGNVTLHNVSVADDPSLDTFSCLPSNPADLAPGASITCTGTHKITQADIDAGSFKDTACVTSTEASK